MSRKGHRPILFTYCSFAKWAGLFALLTVTTQVVAEPWDEMDYGPFLTASVEAPATETNIAYKGIAIRLGQTDNSDQTAAVVFDTDLLRYSVGWLGDYLALKGVVFDGEHWAYPHILGTQVFSTQPLPGWSPTGNFADPREYPYGPLPRTQAHWQGLYLYEDQVILSYTVGKAEVLERAALEQTDTTVAFSRTLNLSTRKEGQTLQIAFEAGRQPTFLRLPDLEETAELTPANRLLATLPSPPPSAVPPKTSLDLAQGLAAHWTFDESAGPSVTRNRYGYELRLHGAARNPDGQTGSALRFAGEQWAEILPTDLLPVGRSDLTLAAWIRTSQDGTLIAKTNGGLEWVPNGVSWFVREGRSAIDIGWVGTIQGTKSIADGQWHHVALTAEAGSGQMTLFVDGQEDGAGSMQPKQTLEGPVIRVGFTADDFPDSPWLNGSIDDLRVYHRILSHEELQQLGAREQPDDALAVAMLGDIPGARWLSEESGNLRLYLPPSAEPQQLKLLLWRGATEALPEFATLVAKSKPAEDLAPYTHGGPARWPTVLKTQGTRGSEDGPYAIDTLTAPEDNPWKSWLRFGGVDIFPDGDRAALCTWNGDVWLVTGIDGNLEHLSWRRIATGLFQPLGLKIVDEQIYVLGRDQITRLHDLNGDGEIDWYENFNNDTLTSEHFHEFATDLKTDAEGNFYYIKCARHARDALHPQHGTLIRVSPDGATSEIVARGFRAVNGLGVGPNGEITCVDNQGHWMPANRINWVEPGGFYGNMWAWNQNPRRTDYDLPLCWMHNFVDRSGGSHLWVPTDQWGPLENELITISYGMGQMFLVLKERVDGIMQGGVTRFPLDFDTGVMRGVFHPQNHQLYTCGLYGWAGNKTKPGGFYRVRYTGNPLKLPDTLHATKDGMVIGFTDPLDPQSARDPGNYRVQAWNYRWTETYGSPDLKLNGQEGRDTWPVESVALSADGKTVFLRLPDIQPVMQMHITLNLRTAEGARVDSFIHNTIHALAPTSGLTLLGKDATIGPVTVVSGLDDLRPGLALSLRTRAAADYVQPDVRVARMSALHVPAGEPVSPFLPAEPFTAWWSGFLKMELNTEVRFRIHCRGQAELNVNGEPVPLVINEGLDSRWSPPLALHSGLNPLVLTYHSPLEEDAELRLFWQTDSVPLEPVPPGAFVHSPDVVGFAPSQQLRRGRDLFAKHRCAKCHQPPEGWTIDGMAELQADAPAWEGIGDRLETDWLVAYLQDPTAFRQDARMPTLLHGNRTDIAQNAVDIAAFLATLRNGANSQNPGEAPFTAEQVSAGEQLWNHLGCLACHLLPGDPPLESDTRIALDYLSRKWKSPALAAFLQSPEKNYRWTRMPNFSLTEAEADGLAAYLFARTETAPSLSQTQPHANAVSRGRTLVSESGCLNCHSLDDVPNQYAAPALSTLADANLSGGCLADPLELNPTKAPIIQLTDQDRADLRAFLEPTALSSLARFVPTEFASRQYADLRCSACHRRDGDGDLWSSLSTDSVETLEQPDYGEDDWDDEDSGATGGTVHLGRPELTYAGEKLHTDWVARFLTGQLPYKPRPESVGRMPAFPAYGEALAIGLADQHGLTADRPATSPVDPNKAAIGQRLTLVGDGFGCVACHDVGEKKALAGADTATINFQFITDRLREEYYWRYLRDPQFLRPGTMMPSFMNPDGTTPITGVFDGDGKQQFQAIWEYLHSIQVPPTD